MIHKIKINSKYYKDVLSGKKNFEIRFNNRKYAVGDKLVLNEVLDNEYTGNKIVVDVIYLLEHKDFPEGIPEGYVVLSIKI